MIFSEQWIREWVNPSLSTQALVDQLTMAGLEVDAVNDVASEFSGVIVAEVVKVEAHPDADKLRVCEVSDGQAVSSVSLWCSECACWCYSALCADLLKPDRTSRKDP